MTTNPPAPLAYRVEQGLTIPPELFDAEGCVTLIVHGAKFGGEWKIVAMSAWRDQPPLGAIWTIDTDPAVAADRQGYPDVGVETAVAWLDTEAVNQPWYVQSHINHNDEHDDELARANCLLAEVALATDTSPEVPRSHVRCGQAPTEELPPVAELGGSGFIDRIMRRLDRTGRWWPGNWRREP